MKAVPIIALACLLSVGAARAIPAPVSDWREVRGADGRVSVLYGSRSEPLPGGPVEAARAFLRSQASRLGLEPGLGDLSLDAVRESRLGTRVRFQQVSGGLPLHGSRVSVFVDADNRVTWVESRYQGPAPEVPAPLLDSDRALAGLSAEPALGGVEGLLEPARLVLFRDGEVALPAWRLSVLGRSGRRMGYLVDAVTGEVLRRRPLAVHALPSALVYEANPKLSPVRRRVELEGLETPDSLRSAFVEVLNKGSFGFRGPTGESVRPNSDGSFRFAPGTGKVSPAHAYYHVARAYDYFRGLGLSLSNPRIAVLIRYREFLDEPYQNAAYIHGDLGTNGALVFGEGLVGEDLALDADIILHEYTHFVHHSVTDSSPYTVTIEGGALNEAIADYFSCSLQGDPAEGEFGGQALNMGGSIRDLRTRSHYPEDIAMLEPALRNSTLIPWAEYHRVGEVFGAALWDLRLALGAEVADQLVYDALSLISDATSFQGAVAALLTVDRQANGGANAEAIRAVFENRGLGEGTEMLYLGPNAFGRSIRLQPYSLVDAGVDVENVGVYVAGRTYSFEGAVFRQPSLDRVTVYFMDEQGNRVPELTVTERISGSTVYDPALGPGWRFRHTLRIPSGLSGGAYHLGIAGYSQGREVVDRRTLVRLIADAGPTPALYPDLPPPSYTSLGDANGDRRLDVSDVLLAVRVMSGLLPYGDEVAAATDFVPRNAEGTVGDGRVSMEEVIRLLRAALGLDSPPRP